MRSILRPAFSASSRHRCSSFSNALSSTASFQRLALDARHDTGNEPARQAHLNDRNQRAVRLEGGEGSAQVVQLLHGVAPSVHISDDGMPYSHRPHRRRRPPHSIFLGGFRTPATSACGTVREWPASETLHNDYHFVGAFFLAQAFRLKVVTSASTACTQQRSCAGSQGLGQRVRKRRWLGELGHVKVWAYHSFGGEVEALNAPAICRLILHAVTSFRA